MRVCTLAMLVIATATGLVGVKVNRNLKDDLEKKVKYE